MITELLDFEMAEGISLKESVYLELKELIVLGEYKPGDRLMEIALSKEMGVSRTPIRSAIKRLEEEYFVEVTPGCGAKVSVLSGKDIENSLMSRLAVEELLIKQAMDNMSNADAKELDDIVCKLGEALGENTYVKTVELDRSFYRKICELSGNDVLSVMLRYLESRTIRYRMEFFKRLTDSSVYVDLLKGLTEAMLGGTLEQANALVRQSIFLQIKILLNR